MDRNDDSYQNACDALYEEMANLLEERAKMRSLWAERAKDKVFKRMDFEYRPLPAPFVFEASAGSNEEDVGQSPLVGSPEGLQQLAENLRQWGKAYLSNNASDLPNIDESKQSGERKSEGDNANHSKSMTWEGWGSSEKQFGLEMQDPWELGIHLVQLVQQVV